jgi:hypothetical protein
MPPRLDRWERLQVSAVLLQHGRVAELESRGPGRLLSRHALRHESLGQQPQMFSDFVVDLIVRLLAP